MRRAQENFEIAQRAIHRMHVAVIGDVITVVLERRGIKWQQPDRGDAEILDVIQLFRQPAKITRAISVRVGAVY